MGRRIAKAAELLDGSLGKRLTALREAKGWSGADLAAASGICRSNLSKLEHGERSDPGVSLVAALAKALGVSWQEVAVGVPLAGSKDALEENARLREELGALRARIGNAMAVLGEAGGSVPAGKFRWGSRKPA